MIWYHFEMSVHEANTQWMQALVFHRFILLFVRICVYNNAYVFVCVCVCVPQKPVSAVSMPEESPYATLGDVEPVNLVSFAHQIAAGMVNNPTHKPTT